jgi:hypothetical protein
MAKKKIARKTRTTKPTTRTADEVGLALLGECSKLAQLPDGKTALIKLMRGIAPLANVRAFHDTSILSCRLDVAREEMLTALEFLAGDAGEGLQTELGHYVAPCIATALGALHTAVREASSITEGCERVRLAGKEVAA